MDNEPVFRADVEFKTHFNQANRIPVKSNIRAAALLTVITTFFAFVATAQSDEGLSTQVEIPYEMFELDNGLQVLVHSDHSTCCRSTNYGEPVLQEP